MAVQSAACTPVALRSGCAAVPHRMRAFRLLGRHAIPCSQSRGEVGIVLSASSRLHDTCAPHTCVPHAPLKSACTARIGWIAHAHVYPSMSPAFDRIAWGMRSLAACALRPHALSGRMRSPAACALFPALARGADQLITCGSLITVLTPGSLLALDSPIALGSRLARTGGPEARGRV